MADYLCITVRWLGDRYHGVSADGKTPEWPPSPYRLFQTLLASGIRAGSESDASGALHWLERQSAPMIIAPRIEAGAARDHFVPDNDNLLSHRRSAIRKYRPSIFVDQTPVHYLWLVEASDPPPFDSLSAVVHQIGYLGWAVDFAFAEVKLSTSEEVDTWSGVRWRSNLALVPRADSLRVPKPHSLLDLQQVHQKNIVRNSVSTERRSAAKPRIFDRVVYYSIERPLARPNVIFDLCNDDDSRFSYAQEKLIHIAGMVRHLAIESMMNSMPEGVPNDWVNTYVAGHAKSGDANHRQFSYLPLLSIGHTHTDPSVRRVMIAVPVGDERFLNHLMRMLVGQQLKPTSQTRLDRPPTLVLTRTDNFTRFYTQPANVWASVTPVILPGHDDHKPEKKRRLIEKALQQSGIDQPCEFEWSFFSHFPKSCSAHKYDRQKRPKGYIRPDHLLNQTAIHLKLHFGGNSKITGPLVIGSGRHCGFGLMAGID